MEYTVTNKEREFYIYTDDYSKSEVNKGILRKHLLRDLKQLPFKGPYLVYDDKNNLYEVIRTMSIRDWNCAELIHTYVGNHFNDFCEENQLGDISELEYVDKNFIDFRDWADALGYVITR